MKFKNSWTKRKQWDKLQINVRIGAIKNSLRRKRD